LWCTVFAFLSAMIILYFCFFVCYSATRGRGHFGSIRSDEQRSSVDQFRRFEFKDSGHQNRNSGSDTPTPGVHYCSRLVSKHIQSGWELCLCRIEQRTGRRVRVERVRRRVENEIASRAQIRGGWRRLGPGRCQWTASCLDRSERVPRAVGVITNMRRVKKASEKYSSVHYSLKGTFSLLDRHRQDFIFITKKRTSNYGKIGFFLRLARSLDRGELEGSIPSSSFTTSSPFLGLLPVALEAALTAGLLILLCNSLSHGRDRVLDSPTVVRNKPSPAITTPVAGLLPALLDRFDRSGISPSSSSEGKKSAPFHKLALSGGGALIGCCIDRSCELVKTVGSAFLDFSSDGGDSLLRELREIDSAFLVWLVPPLERG